MSTSCQCDFNQVPGDSCNCDGVIRRRSARPRPPQSKAPATVNFPVTSLVLRLLDVYYATDDIAVRTAAEVIAADPESWQNHIVYLARLQAEAKKEMFDRLTKMVQRNMDPPIIVMHKMPDIQLEPGGIVEAGDWPKTERTVIEKSERVYFRDFLRSLWRRWHRA